MRNEKKARVITVRCYAARLIDLNEYLTSFMGENFNGNIGVTELREILPNSMPNSWYIQAYVQGFDCESITLKNVNIFDRMEIAKYTYESVVKNYH